MSFLAQLEGRLGYNYSNEILLTRALTHRSFGADNYERLEFLGDAILNAAIAEYLFHQFQTANEGQLSRLRARIVRQSTLADVARHLELKSAMQLGQGELKSGGFNRDSILSDVLEAIIGSIYLEAGHEVVVERILTWFKPALDGLSLENSEKDAKSLLQEFLQGRGAQLPDYEVTEIVGKSHDQAFTVECRSELLESASIGEGTSRRGAEQQAAAKVLARLTGVDS